MGANCGPERIPIAVTNAATDSGAYSHTDGGAQRLADRNSISVAIVYSIAGTDLHSNERANTITVHHAQHAAQHGAVSSTVMGADCGTISSSSHRVAHNWRNS